VDDRQIHDRGRLTGFEVAHLVKPLAAPVLGGMLGSLIHVLIVTPVIFTWLRERQILPAA